MGPWKPRAVEGMAEGPGCEEVEGWPMEGATWPDVEGRPVEGMAWPEVEGRGKEGAACTSEVTKPPSRLEVARRLWICRTSDCGSKKVMRGSGGVETNNLSECAITPDAGLTTWATHHLYGPAHLVPGVR